MPFYNPGTQYSKSYRFWIIPKVFTVGVKDKLISLNHNRKAYRKFKGLPCKNITYTSCVKI